jgi:hypothetical protein
MPETEGPAAPDSTGEPRVDDALRRLDELEHLPVAEHPPVFEAIHGQLVEVLGELRTGVDPTDPADQRSHRAGPDE